MFKNEFQGSAMFEIFSSTCSPLAQWKLSNKSYINKSYEKDVRGFCYNCEKIGRLSLPKDEKQPAYLIQPYLVFQLFVPLGQSLSIELCISDLNQNHRRFFMSTAHREIKNTALHVNLPLPCIRRGSWLNLCFDLCSLVSENFSGYAFRSLDGITMSGTFRLRKVFTLKNRPPDTTGDEYLNYEQDVKNMASIPKGGQFPIGVEYINQVITMNRLLFAISGLKEDMSILCETQFENQKQSSNPNVAFGRTYKESILKSSKKIFKSKNTEPSFSDTHDYENTSVISEPLKLTNNLISEKESLPPIALIPTKSYNPILYASPQKTPETLKIVKENISTDFSSKESTESKIPKFKEKKLVLPSSIPKKPPIKTKIPLPSVKKYNVVEDSAESSEFDMQSVSESFSNILHQFKADSESTLMDKHESLLDTYKNVYGVNFETEPHSSTLTPVSKEFEKSSHEIHKKTSAAVKNVLKDKDTDYSKPNQNPDISFNSDGTGEDGQFELVYDPIKECFHDPRTGKSYNVGLSDDDS